MLTEGFCYAVVKMLQNVILMYECQCIFASGIHTLCKTDPALKILSYLLCTFVLKLYVFICFMFSYMSL